MRFMVITKETLDKITTNTINGKEMEYNEVRVKYEIVEGYSASQIMDIYGKDKEGCAVFPVVDDNDLSIAMAKVMELQLNT